MSIDTTNRPPKDARPDPRDAGRPTPAGVRRRPKDEGHATEPATELAPTPILPSPTADWEAPEDDPTIRLQPDSAPDPSIPVWIDRVIAGRYCLEREIGRGGFGIVMLAYDRELHRQVAIKVARRTRDRGTDHLLEEGRKVAQLDHPNIVPVYDCGRIDDRTIFIVSKYIDGGSLARRMALRKLPIGEAMTIAREVADALAHAHERGLIHRDLKPSNILIDSKNTAYVADFGLALRATDRSDLACVEGSPQYMSPEQASGKSRLVDRRTDVFSFGVILYEMITGERPFPGRLSAEYREQVIHAEPPSPSRLAPAISPRLEAVCRKALSKNPADRHASAWELARELRQCRDWDGPRHWTRLSLVVSAATLLLAAAVLVLALRLFGPQPLTSRGGSPPPATRDAPDLRMAGWILSESGSVDFNDVFPPTIHSAETLPMGPVTLRSLSLYGAGPIADARIEEIARLGGVSSLHLGKTGLTDDQLAELSRLPRLKLLIVCYNALTDRGLSRLGPPDGLKHLDLAGTLVTDEGLDALASSPRLRFLNLSDTEIGDAGIRRLRGLALLEELSVDRTRITDACVDDLLQLPHLKWLRASETALSDEAADRLRAGPSGCRVIR
ncbi:serine/threonine-protein kinase [Tautonia plasticadhaerens]|uniref:Serine/threonine-protein kinase PrkC n=1 Tax=Tautonia plasticadhaerens TaxID=2527974 RepID=A0A518HD98_9BACT|nr:serine/threonine-protein kinase [Tautonia plasticadhaerens]QDV38810.1 Serine/threonine-protein kinase PrkC [Tautonia plasticadhaerens]